MRWWKFGSCFNRIAWHQINVNLYVFQILTYLQWAIKMVKDKQNHGFHQGSVRERDFNVTLFKVKVKVRVETRGIRDLITLIGQWRYEKCLNHVMLNLFWGNREAYLHFPLFLHTEMARLIEICLSGKRGLVYLAWLIWEMWLWFQMCEFQTQSGDWYLEHLTLNMRGPSISV